MPLSWSYFDDMSQNIKYVIRYFSATSEKLDRNLDQTRLSLKQVVLMEICIKVSNRCTAGVSVYWSKHLRFLIDHGWTLRFDWANVKIVLSSDHNSIVFSCGEGSSNFHRAPEQQAHPISGIEQKEPRKDDDSSAAVIPDIIWALVDKVVDDTDTDGFSLQLSKMLSS